MGSQVISIDLQKNYNLRIGSPFLRTYNLIQNLFQVLIQDFRNIIILIQMKYLLIVCIVILLNRLQATPVDQLNFVYTSTFSVSSVNGASNKLNMLENSYDITFNSSFIAIPSIGVNLVRFQTSTNIRYAVQISYGLQTQTGFKINVYLSQNYWISLAICWIASIADSIVLGKIDINNLGARTTITPIQNIQTIAISLVNPNQNQVKFEVFILGFNIDTSTSGTNNSQLTLSASINYNSNDMVNSLYNTLSDYIYPVINGSLNGGNTGGAIVIASSQTRLVLNLAWLGTLYNIQLTYIAHPVIVTSTATIKLTTGYNTFAITSNSTSKTANLFNAVNNKNNLASLYAAAFYGFTGISLTPISSIDASIIQYTTSATIASTTSTINQITTSYYFYQPLASDIVSNIFDTALTIVLTWAPYVSLVQSTTNIYPYYPLAFSSSVSVFTTRLSLAVTVNSNYMLIIQVLDQQGCWNNRNFFPTTITIAPIVGISTSSHTQSSSVSSPFVNPDSQCTSSTTLAQFSTPVQRSFWTYAYSFTTTGTSAMISLTFSSILTDIATPNNLFVKKFRVYKISPNDIINPIITEATYSSVDYFYNFQTSTSSSYTFYSAYSANTPSNAIQLSIQNSNPITISPSSNLNLVVGKIYTISFYILDSATNLPSVFSNPRIFIFLNGIQIYTQSASLNNPFFSILCTATNIPGILTTPTSDDMYAKINFVFTATQVVNTLSLVLSDSSTTAHIYWIRGISVANILIFDPVSRTNVYSCPTNSYLLSNTQPQSCQTCPAGKIATIYGCICGPSTYLESSTGFCKNCLYTCETCQANNPKICISCLANRAPGPSLNCPCIIGYVQINQVCTACNRTCRTCINTISTCASCNKDRQYTSNSTCVCLSGTYDDGVQVQCKTCPANCKNCQLSGGSVICTSCPVQITPTRSITSRTCACLDGFYQKIPITASCQACHYSCATCNGPTSQNCLTCASATRNLQTATNSCPCRSGSLDRGNPTCNKNSCSIIGCSICSGETCVLCDSVAFRQLNRQRFLCECMIGYYQSNNNTCVQCPVGCTSCTTSTKCLTCYSLATLISGQCICPDRTFLDQLQKSCITCPSICAYCTSSTNCVTCSTGFTSINGVCVCNAGTYLPSGGSNCVGCPKNSTTCDSTGNILTCLTNYYLYNGNCVSPCPANTYNNGNNGITCIDCPSTCSSCTGSNTCTACVSTNLLYKGACIDSCPSNTFTSNKTCIYCHSSCLTCTGSTSSSCSSCPKTPTQTYLSTNSCVTSCPVSTIGVNGVCVACDPSCYTCNDTTLSDCLSCTTNPQKYLLGTTCVTSCPSTSIAINGTCVACHPSCSTCAVIITNCTSCISTYSYTVNQSTSCVAACPTLTYILNTQCVSPCPSQYFANGNTCQQCSTLCGNCTTSATTCSSCPVSNYLHNGSCVSVCPVGTMINIILASCQSCDPTCTSCNAPNSTNSCTACVSGLQLTTLHTCIPLCTGSTFFDNTTCKQCSTGCSICTSARLCTNCTSTIAALQNGKCITCRSPCATCTNGSITECATCTGIYGLSNNQCVNICPNSQSIIKNVCTCPSGITDNGNCVSTCPTGKTAINNICQLCDKTCRTCINTISTCTSCNIDRQYINSVCICLSGTYDDGVHAQCKKCPASCKNCQLSGGSVICTSCIVQTRSTISSTCACLDGFFFLISITPSCQACHYSCATCNGSANNNCLTCSLTRSIQRLTNTCPCYYGYIDIGNPSCAYNKCVDIIGCIDCINSTVCDLCDVSVFRELNQSTFVCDCMTGYYLNNNTCVQCPVGCTSCTTSTKCLTCYSLATPISGLCPCPNGTYPNQPSKQCISCPSICAYCTSSTNCVTCSTGFTSINGVCVCNAGTYLPSGGSNCVACPKNSTTCDSTGNILTCLTNYYLYNGNCVSPCPANTYNNGNNGITCIDCPSTCSSCTGSNTCTACVSTNLLYKGACIDSCPSNTFTSNKTCIYCHSSCLTCTGSTSSSCSSCPKTPTQTYLSTNSCVTSCPVSTIGVNGVCVACDPSCYTCNDTTLSDCLSCTTNPQKYLLGTTCVTSCPSTSIAINGTCVACHPSCSTCAVIITNCTSCISTYSYTVNQSTSCVAACPTLTYILNTQCVSPCPSQYFANGNTCQQCSTLCGNCTTSATTCSSCPVSNYLHNGSCVSVCPVGTMINIILASCQSCDPTCTSCNAPNSTNSCTACVSGLQLTTLHTCIPLCTGSTFFDNTTCKQCSTGCSICTSARLCTNCTSTIAALQNGKCITCRSPCATCTNGSITECATCIGIYGLSNNQCVKFCPHAQMIINNICTCLSGLTYNGDCVTMCPTGTTQIGTQCNICSSNCATCLISATRCTSCNAGRILNTATQSCSCPAGTYDDCIHTKCQPCPLNCQNCQLINNIVTCLSCVPSITRSSTIINGNCPCLNGFTQNNPITSSCQACSYTCATCNGPAINNCVTCNQLTHRILIRSVCQCNTGYADIGLPTCIINQCTNITGCIECINNHCTQCDSLLFRSLDSLNNCTCMNGYYQNSNNQCQTCPVGCIACTSANNCTRCYNKIQVNLGSCACPTGKYLDIGTQTCSSCPSICLSCTSSSNCLTCATGFDQVNGVCICNSGKFLPLPGLSCLLCPVNSATCSSQTVATTCALNYYLYQNSCLVNCPVNTYTSGGLCLSCPTTCSLCTGPTTCTSCISPNLLYNGVCASSCPSSTYISSSSCLNCHSSCLTCNGATSSSCLSCPTSPIQTYLSRSTCVINCESGTTVINGACIACDSKCLTCLGTQSTCTTCQPSYYLYLTTHKCIRRCPRITFQIDNQCVDSCPSGTFDSGGFCSKCDLICDTCISTSTNCTRCPASTYLYNGNCATTCPLGTILVAATSSCESCAATCNTCTTPTNCSTCATGLLLTSLNTCIPQCSGSTYFNGTTCQPCSSGCSNCSSAILCLNCIDSIAVIQAGNCVTCLFPCANCVSNSATICLTCIDGYGLSNGNCLTTCPNNQFINNGICVCLSGIMYNGNCVTSCPLGTILVDGASNCQPCDVTCRTCTTPTNCSRCATGLLLTSLNTCIPQCTGSTYFDGTTCQSCSPGCSSCTSIILCLYCANSIAVIQDGNCVTCVFPCATCASNSATICLTCIDGYGLSNVNCLSACPNGQFISNGVCACPSGIMYNGNCVIQCPYGTTRVDNQCQVCSIICASCSIAITNCTSCQTGYHLVGNNCTSINTCPYGQALVTGNCANICAPKFYYQLGFCVQSCYFNQVPNFLNSGCVDQVSIISCLNGQYLWQNSCVTTCPARTMISGTSCVSCIVNCAQCMAVNTCSICDSGYVLANNVCILPTVTCTSTQLLLSNTCVSSCPPGTYQQGTNCMFKCPNGFFFSMALFSCILLCPSNTIQTTYACV